LIMYLHSSFTVSRIKSTDLPYLAETLAETLGRCMAVAAVLEVPHTGAPPPSLPLALCAYFADAVRRTLLLSSSPSSNSPTLYILLQGPPRSLYPSSGHSFGMIHRRGHSQFWVISVVSGLGIGSESSVRLEADRCLVQRLYTFHLTRKLDLKASERVPD
jgi:hypothetical protein